MNIIVQHRKLLKILNTLVSNLRVFVCEYLSVNVMFTCWLCLAWLAYYRHKCLHNLGKINKYMSNISIVVFVVIMSYNVIVYCCSKITISYV